MRAANSSIAFSTDFIVGFPGETDEDFSETLSLVDEVGFASAFSFKYSPRPGTPAADMDSQVPEEVKTERLHRLQATLDRHHQTFNAGCVGSTFDVLFEKAGRYPGQIVGRSPYLQPVQVMAPSSMIGTIAGVTIMEASTNSLFGALAQTPAQAREPIEAEAGV
jgi:tRNA-2-methylthio-N6-dimethylallyladenosine synthase